MCFVLVIHDVLEVNASIPFEVVKELLLKDVRSSSDFLDAIFLFRVMVDEVCRNTHSQLTAKFFLREAAQRVSLSVSSCNNASSTFISSKNCIDVCANPQMSAVQQAKVGN